MYRLMAIAKYEDRYVIPKAHEEQAHDLEEMGCAVDFDDGPGMGAGMFGEASGARCRSRWRPSRRSSGGRPPRASRPTESMHGRVNLLNWDGVGVPVGLFPGVHDVSGNDTSGEGE